ncbi:MAG: c-type cytochrome [Betaproteobacteria bacterium]|nr:c-type cytochrome [Betaproteobacteria bacterium]
MIGRIVSCSLSVALALAVVPSVARAGAGGADTPDQARPVTGDSEEHNPYTGNPAAIEEGRKLWRKTGCYSCHGGVAEGGVGPSLVDDEWIYVPTDKTLFKTISEGRKGTVMVSWSKELKPDQIWKVIAYIRSLYQGDPKKIIW